MTANEIIFTIVTAILGLGVLRLILAIFGYFLGRTIGWTAEGIANLLMALLSGVLWLALLPVRLVAHILHDRDGPDEDQRNRHRLD